jgi:hypothetical protein
MSMEIVVNKSKKLKTIQEEFQKNFPFLKLEFYSTSHKKSEGTFKNATLNSNLTVGEASRFSKETVVHINKKMKVSELENAFTELFGLNAQVFRKSNNTWLQTTITDNWTLEKQNQNGLEMNSPEKAYPEENDYHEQE